MAQLWNQHHDALREQVSSCVRSGSPREVNFSVSSHPVTTAVLRHFSYDARYRGCALPIVFSDNSHPATFPLGELDEVPLPPRQTWEKQLNVGLMSFRHPDMDFLVDLYLTRNCDLAEDQPLAVKEALAFERTVEFFDDPSFRDGAEIYTFHTGFEPMVVGVYRGIVETIRRRKQQGAPRNLVIVPCVFNAKDSGPPYTTASTGAKITSYESLAAWW